MAETPHIAQSHGNASRSGLSAGCADPAHIAKSPRKSLKNHNRPKPHIAALYPAIGRLWVLTPSTARYATPEHDLRVPLSSRPSGVGAWHE
jgi:hypothetical protein